MLLGSLAAYLADQGLSPQTVKTYLASVRNTQISLDFPDPKEHPIFKRVQAGIARLRLLKLVLSPVHVCLSLWTFCEH